MDAMDKKRETHLCGFETEVRRLLGGYDKCSAFFGRHPSMNDAMWTIAHFTFGTKTPEVGAKDWFDECVQPMLDKDASKE